MSVCRPRMQTPGARGGGPHTNGVPRAGRFAGKQLSPVCGCASQGALTATYASQSAGCTAWSSVSGYCCTRHTCGVVHRAADGAWMARTRDASRGNSAWPRKSTCHGAAQRLLLLLLVLLLSLLLPASSRCCSTGKELLVPRLPHLERQQCAPQVAVAAGCDARREACRQLGRRVRLHRLGGSCQAATVVGRRGQPRQCVHCRIGHLRPQAAHGAQLRAPAGSPSWPPRTAAPGPPPATAPRRARTGSGCARGP